MHSYDSELSQRLKLRFGLSQTEPNQFQLDGIKQDIRQLHDIKGNDLTIDDWSTVVKRWCPSFQTHRYLGIDNSDINSLLILATRNEK